MDIGVLETETWPAELINFIGPKIKVIYSDVDGTLLGPGGCLLKDADHNLTDEPARAIMDCHRNNIDVVLVSGRNSQQLRSDARLLGFSNWIAELGCEIVYSKEEVILTNIGDYPLTETSVWAHIQQSGAPDLLLNSYQGYLEYHVPYSRGRNYTHLLRGQIDTDQANKLLAANGYTNLKVIDNGPVKRRSEQIHSSVTELHAYHLLPIASGKASAVLRDRQMRMIDKEQTAAIGDSAADLELSPEVGTLFLVRNALMGSPELESKVKDFANVIITNESMGLGWAEAVRFLLYR